MPFLYYNESPLIKLDFQSDAPDFCELVPVRFTIGEVDLLGAFSDGEQNPWHPLWVHFFSTNFIYALWSSNDRIGVSLSLGYGSYLSLRTIEEWVILESDFTNRCVFVEYSRLYQALKKFGLRVKEAVTTRHPGMRAYKWWTILETDQPEEFENFYRSQRQSFDRIERAWFKGDSGDDCCEEIAEETV